MKNRKKVYEVETKTVDEIDCENYNYEHFNDGYIDLRVIPEFYVWVITEGISGKAMTIAFDDNFFSVRDLLKAYLSLWEDDWATEETKKEHIDAFKRWLIDIGAQVEDLED